MTTDSTQTPIRRAATLVVLRQGDQGPEVLMLRRADKGDQNSGAWVFPGGLVDPGDAQCHDLCVGLSDHQASAQLNLPGGGLDHHVAAIRECFEEAGILLAQDGRGQRFGHRLESHSTVMSERERVARGELGLRALCERHDLRLSVERLLYIAHWITPPVRPKRFDTRFFLATVQADQQADHDTVETINHQWLRPADMLCSDQADRLMMPQRSVLQALAQHDSMPAVLKWAAEVQVVTRP
jgi:8-oxo-dGTP pyrophosphatase MutT (NUDIX family)